MTDDMRIEGVASPADLEPAGEAGPEARLEQLATEIDETRDGLTDTIAAIGDKLDPSNIAREASDSVRQATLGKVEQMTYGAQETWRDVRTGNTGSIVDTISSNPVPTGMVALGLGMLLMNRGARGSAYRGYDRDARRYDHDQYGRDRASWQDSRFDRPAGGGSPLDTVGRTVSDAGDAVGRAAEDAGRRMTGVMEGVGQGAGDMGRQAGWMVEQRAGQVRRFIDESPLGSGLLALAAGAALGLVLPTTTLEREAIGPARDDLVEKAESAAHQALDKVEEQVDAAQSGA
jgi:hypothetical protein